MAQFLPLRSPRRQRTVTGQQQPEIVSKRPINRLLEGQRKHATGSFPFSDAAEKRALRRTGAQRRNRASGIFLRTSGILALRRTTAASSLCSGSALRLASSRSRNQKKACKERDRYHVRFWCSLPGWIHRAQVVQKTGARSQLQAFRIRLPAL